MPVPRPFRPFLRPGAAPLLLLLAALSSIFLFGNDRGHFYRPGHHDYVSAEHMAIVANLSPAHRFLMIRSVRRVYPPRQYNLYNRFPLGGYALFALTTSPFRGDLSLRLHAARMLTLGFFAAAAVLAYLALSRLAASRWTALTATLLAFSSYYGLYYNDMIHPEVVPGLFGVLLTFHGVVVFLQDGRFRQLLVKTCAALLLAWHVLALVAAFVVLALARELRARLVHRVGAGGLPRPRHCLTLGAVSLLLFASLLTFNFVNEYAAMGGTQAWTDLPSVNSMKRRTGFNRGFHERFVDQLAWRPFLEEQFRRIGTASIPWALLRGFESDGTPHPAGDDPHPPRALAAGVVMTAAALAVLPFVGGRFPAGVLVLSGFCWSLPMRHQTAFHDYYVLFHVGVPLVVFAAGAAGLRRLAGDRAAVALSAAALAIFVLSSRDMSGVGHDAEAAREDQALTSDFEIIRRMTAGRPVYMPDGFSNPSLAGAPNAQCYFLARSVLLTHFLSRPRPCHPGFVVTRERVAGATLLTPGNRRVFLYDRGDYDRNTAGDAGAPEAGRPGRRKTDCSHLGQRSGPSPASPRSG